MLKRIYNYFIKPTTRVVLLLLITITAILCCKNKRADYERKAYLQNPETLMRINKYMVKQDSEKVVSFINRSGWDMKLLPTGLWYSIYHQGEGNKAEVDKYATISYTLSLLDGTVCYKADSTKPKRFKIGHGGVESGLEEGILMLRQGDKARFIILPGSAHGLVGDENKIPPMSTIIYDLTVLKISDN